MWLQNLKIRDKKNLSPVELLILSTSDSHEWTAATQAIIDVNKQIPSYNAERGTFYPVLKRLQNERLIELKSGNKIQFKRTPYGNEILTRLSIGIKDQLETSTNYFQYIITGLVKVNPVFAHDMLTAFKLQIKTMSFKIDEALIETQSVLDKEKWVEISLDDENEDNNSNRSEPKDNQNQSPLDD